VFPTVTYPNHATIVTGVRPARHGVLSNTIPTPAGTRGRWYEEATDLRAAPIWEWARAGGLTTAAVSWPVTVGARIDLLVPERDYYTQKNPLERLHADSTAGIFERLGVTPRPAMFKDVVLWDAFLTEIASAMIRQARPNLLLLHLVQTDFFQHQFGRAGAEVKAAVARVDAHIGTLRRALGEAGPADRWVMIVSGDHGFEDVRRGPRWQDACSTRFSGERRLRAPTSVNPDALVAAQVHLRGSPNCLVTTKQYAPILAVVFSWSHAGELRDVLSGDCTHRHHRVEQRPSVAR
jgi:predicted AlkP superfamily pyrophosphatase or phosphodiesterase